MSSIKVCLEESFQRLRSSLKRLDSTSDEYIAFSNQYKKLANKGQILIDEYEVLHKLIKKKELGVKLPPIDGKQTDSNKDFTTLMRMIRHSQ